MADHDSIEGSACRGALSLALGLRGAGVVGLDADRDFDLSTGTVSYFLQDRDRDSPNLEAAVLEVPDFDGVNLDDM